MDCNLGFERKIEKGKEIMSKKALFSVFFAMACLISLSAISFAQEVTGSIVGTVRDSNGAAVAGATVTLTDPSKGNLVVRTEQLMRKEHFPFPISASASTVSRSKPRTSKKASAPTSRSTSASVGQLT